MKQLGILIFALLSQNCFSQATSQDPFVGVWRGTSICQQKNSPCKNENVVYHISAGTGKNLYVMQANKIVNGQEEEMGIIPFTYADSIQSLVNKDVDRQNRKGVWIYKLQGKNMDGTLTVDGVLYRIIHVKKDN